MKWESTKLNSNLSPKQEFFYFTQLRDSWRKLAAKYSHISLLFIFSHFRKCRGNSSSHQERNNSNRPSNTTVPSGGGRNYRTSNNHRSVSQNGSYVDINGDLVGGHYEGLEPKYDHPYLKPIWTSGEQQIMLSVWQGSLHHITIYSTADSGHNCNA